jgi:hypothetical protein
MQEEVVTERGDAYSAAHAAGVFGQHAGLGEQRRQLRVEQPGLKRDVPAQDVREAARELAIGSGDHPRMGLRRRSGEAIAPGFQACEQASERRRRAPVGLQGAWAVHQKPFPFIRTSSQMVL